ncbi:MAG: ribonuclease HI family protein [Candidatus Colwellbacteria bacterium]|nr:ribonuclease HI family protein [Candidatus Colwellbacteria bacterium]
MSRLIIYIDGGARGNPGPAAIGVIIGSLTGEKKYQERIGRTTNNVAEYKAAIFALKKAKQILGKNKSLTEIEIRSDSELLCKQMNGLYKIKNKELQSLFIELWNLRQDFKKVAFLLIKREQNKAADSLVNRALDTLGL